MTANILCIGEVMVELAPVDQGLFRVGYAGDTFNTAWYTRRLLGADATVTYGTCIGTDQVSDDLMAYVKSQGIDTTAMRRVPDRTLGLYLISLNHGERSFSYWRGQSAAKTLADDEEWLNATVQGRDIIHFSGITLAILSPAAREQLVASLSLARAKGAKIIFDTNLRPRLWEDAKTMRDGLTLGASVADVILPSFDEEVVAFGDRTPSHTIQRYRALGAATVIVKNGSDAVVAWDSGQGSHSHMPPQVTQIDSTAAGDSFGAAVIAGIILNETMDQMIHSACQLASRVIQSRGALLPDIFQQE